MTATNAGTVLAHGQFFGRAGQKVDVDGFALARMRPDPGIEIERHTHHTAHFIFHFAGVYVTTARGAPAVCGAPTVVWNPAGTTHRDRYQRVNGRVAGEFFSIAVDDARMARVADHVALAGHATCVAGGEMLATVGRLVRECRQWDRASPLVAEGLCLELLAQAARHDAHEHVAPPAWLARARELLNDRCADDLSIGDAASACGVHPVHLARMFRRHFRCSPGDFLRRARLARAVALLGGSRRSLGEIAVQSGFADQSHMTKAFRRAYAVTPGQYRALIGGRDVAS